MANKNLIKFGSIHEDDNGVLNFTGFHIDGKGRFEDAPSNVAILTLAKERIEEELYKLKNIIL